MTPAVKIHQDARGQWQQHPVQLHYSAPQPLEAALAKVREGRTVFVTEADAATVLDAFVKEQRRGGDSAEWLNASDAPAVLEGRNWQRVNMPAAPATPYTLTPWPESVDKRLDALEAEVKALRELMRRLEDGK